MIKQLRPFYSPEELSRVYSEPYDSTKWPDHILRVQYTAKLLRDMNPRSVADLSCGDGQIVKQSGVTCPVTLGDYTARPENWYGDSARERDWYSGPIEETIDDIPGGTDVFVLSETLEHVERPGRLLDKIRDKADRLLLTTPCGEDNAENPQHYWGWDTEGVGELLQKTMWRPYEDVELYVPPCSTYYYTFQIWRCQ